MPDDTEQLKKAKKYALLLLRFRPRSVSEFTGKLSGHGFSSDVVGQVVSDFKKRGLLDDAKFANLWIGDRMHLKPMGKFRLKTELEAKGIDDEVAEEALKTGLGTEDEYESAKALAQKRLAQLTDLDRVTAKRRLAGYLQRRGFPYDAVIKVVKEVMSK